ncbi:hypothetical protein ACFU8I_02885 [Streptomyces sp. NPDC057540]|uniref:hypothetical protein n=1 Tax=Streptomyces sp. NPDC057540 TaxID=3346160 RepID=UPI0036986F40
MRLFRFVFPLLLVLGLSLIGLYLGPALAHAADITDLQAGLIVGVVITWAAFRIAAVLPDTEPTPTTDQG